MEDKKRGRPKEDLSRDAKIDVRMNVGERAMLDILAEKTGLSKAQIMRDALKNYYKNSIKF